MFCFLYTHCIPITPNVWLHFSSLNTLVRESSWGKIYRAFLWISPNPAEKLVEMYTSKSSQPYHITSKSGELGGSWWGTMGEFTLLVPELHWLSLWRSCLCLSFSCLSPCSCCRLCFLCLCLFFFFFFFPLWCLLELSSIGRVFVEISVAGSALENIPPKEVGTGIGFISVKQKEFNQIFLIIYQRTNVW